MRTENRFFDDLARAAGGTLGALHGLRTEAKGLVQQRLERVISDMNLVTREEFDRALAMARKAREENEVLAARLEALEATAKPTKKPPKKPAA